MKKRRRRKLGRSRAIWEIDFCFFTGFVFFVRAEGSKRWDKQYYRRSKEGGEELGGGGRCLPREVQQQQQQQHQDQQKPHQSFCAIPSQTSWFPASWCRLFQKKPKKPPSPSGEKGGGGEGRLTVISCNSQVCIFFAIFNTGCPKKNALSISICWSIPSHQIKTMVAGN